MSCFGSRFLLAKPAGCKVAGCAHPHPFAQVHRLMIEPDWLMKEPPAGSFLPSFPSKLRHRHPSSLTEVGWHEGSTERSPWKLAVLRKLWYAGIGCGHSDHPEHRRPCRYRDDWALSPCSGIHSAECGPVVQWGVFGLKIGRNSTNYREPAFQIVGINAGSHIAADDVASKKPTCPCDWPDKIFGIVVKIVVKTKWGQPINKKIQRFLTWNRWIYGPAELDKSELFPSTPSAVKASSNRTVWVPSL